MKKLSAFLFLVATVTAAMAQGTVIFANGPTTLMSFSPNALWGATNPTPRVLPPAPVGAYMYALLISPSANGPFFFSGVYATNTAAGDRLGDVNFQQSVPGWAAGTGMFFEVFGWTANTLGSKFNNGWLVNNVPVGSLLDLDYNTYSGLSGIGYGTAGGGVVPPLPIFGGISGFELQNTLVPEPGAAALSCLGFGLWFIYRRRKQD